MLNTTSTSLARVVLSYVEWMSSENKDPEIDVYPYHNGREHGYALMSWHEGTSEWRLAVFAEFRRSDDIVVYTGTTAEFDSNGSPLDEPYERKELFRWNEASGAADAVLAYLRGK